MRPAERIEAYAACVERTAQYAHEYEYIAGLREAADILAQPGSQQINLLLHEIRSAHVLAERRKGMLKALDIAEGDDPSPNVGLRLERVETAVEALRTQIAGLAMIITNQRRVIDLQEREQHDD